MNLKFKAFVMVTSILAFSVELAQGEAKRIEKAEQRATATNDNIFTRDTTNPGLGEAYRDPSGLIWGDVIKAQGMSQTDADIYCKCNSDYARDKLGCTSKPDSARLPTREEFKQLAEYLDDGSAQRYSPLSADGRTDVIPGLSRHWFWTSSTRRSDFPDVVYTFNGRYGYFDSSYRSSLLVTGRCVSGR